MSEALTIANDVSKALEALPIITNTIAAAQSSLTTDEHASVVQKTLDLVNVAGASATAVAASGAVGQNDATNIKNAVSAVESGAPIVGLFAAFVSHIKAAFSWL